MGRKRLRKGTPELLPEVVRAEDESEAKGGSEGITAMGPSPQATSGFRTLVGPVVWITPCTGAAVPRVSPASLPWCSPCPGPAGCHLPSRTSSQEAQWTAPWGHSEPKELLIDEAELSCLRGQHCATSQELTLSNLPTTLAGEMTLSCFCVPQPLKPEISNRHLQFREEGHTT